VHGQFHPRVPVAMNTSRPAPFTDTRSVGWSTMDAKPLVPLMSSMAVTRPDRRDPASQRGCATAPDPIRASELPPCGAGRGDGWQEAPRPSLSEVHHEAGSRLANARTAFDAALIAATDDAEHGSVNDARAGFEQWVPATSPLRQCDRVITPCELCKLVS
jgi:hypothetical protein